MSDGPVRYFDVEALLASFAQQGLERPALTFYRARTRAGHFTYGQLLAAVGRYTRRLRDELGLRPGDAMAVLSPNRLEVPPLLLAAMRLGLTLVPLNPTTPPGDWDYIIDHARVTAIFGTRDLLARLVRAPKLVCAFEDEPAVAADEPTTLPPVTPVPPAEAAPAVVLYTSGTTGNPKGVALMQASLLANAWSMAVNFRLSGETQMAVLPLYHAHALGFGLMSALTTGGHLVFVEKFDPFSWADVIRAESVTLTSVVPTLLAPLLQVGLKRDRVPGLRAILVSSAPLTATLAHEFEAKAGVPLVEGWGLSEYTNFACCLSPHLPDEERRRRLIGDSGTPRGFPHPPATTPLGEAEPRQRANELTSIGSPLSGTEVKVVGPGGETLSAEARGELCVRGHSTMRAYFRDPAATAAVLDADGWLRTGDEGFFRMFNDDPVFFITGRIKETIIRDGDKYSPLAIERQLLLDLPELEGRLVALGFPHEAHGEEIGVYLELEAVDDDLRARLTRAVNAMPMDQRPKVVLFGAAPIPRTHTGKIQRRKLHPVFAPYAKSRGALRIEPGA